MKKAFVIIQDQTATNESTSAAILFDPVVKLSLAGFMFSVLASFALHSHFYAFPLVVGLSDVFYVFRVFFSLACSLVVFFAS